MKSEHENAETSEPTVKYALVRYLNDDVMNERSANFTY